MSTIKNSNHAGKILFLLLMFGYFHQGFAQNNFSFLTEPAISLTITNPTKWSYDFSLSNQQILFKNNDFTFRGKYLELSHFTKYSISNNSKLGLGLRYRFKDLYGNGKDEASILEQFEYSKKYNNIKTTHRLRLEERFGEKTAYRNRYKFSILIPLDENDGGYSLGGYTEGLWSIAPSNKPLFEQRLGSYFEKMLSSHYKLDLGLEYRLQDYTGQPKNEVFLTSQLKISI